MTKTTKILLIILIIIMIGAISYFGYNYYQKNQILEEKSQEEDWDEYVKFIKNTSKQGLVKEISDNKINIKSLEKEEEFEYIITENTLFEKLGEIDNDGRQSFVEAIIDDIKIDDTVWIFFDLSSKNQASIIKNISTDISYPTL